MKKGICFLLCVVLAVSLMPFGAFAANEKGIYGIDPTADGEAMGAQIKVLALNSENKLSDAEADANNSYPDGVALSVTINTKKDLHYLILVTNAPTIRPLAEQILYINQETANGSTLTFDTVYPNSLSVGTYYVYVSDSEGNALTHIASFSYAAGDIGDPTVIRRGRVLEPYDGDLTLDDAITILQDVAKVKPLDDYQKLAADVAEPFGEITLDDGIAVLRVVAKVDPPFAD